MREWSCSVSYRSLLCGRRAWRELCHNWKATICNPVSGGCHPFIHGLRELSTSFVTHLVQKRPKIQHISFSNNAPVCLNQSLFQDATDSPQSALLLSHTPWHSLVSPAGLRSSTFGSTWVKYKYFSNLQVQAQVQALVVLRWHEVHQVLFSIKYKYQLLW